MRPHTWADDFNRAVDARMARLIALGAVVGAVADHGMNDKSKPDGRPNVIFLEDELERRFGAGPRASSARLPIRSCAITGRLARSCGSTARPAATLKG